MVVMSLHGKQAFHNFLGKDRLAETTPKTKHRASTAPQVNAPENDNAVKGYGHHKLLIPIKW
jgi:hypothetical protein